MNQQVATGVGERGGEINLPSRNLTVSYRSNRGHGSQARGDLGTGGAGAKIVVSDVGQSYSYFSTAEGDTDTLLGVEGHRSDLSAIGHSELTSAINHLVLETIVHIVARNGEVLILGGTAAHVNRVGGDGNSRLVDVPRIGVG